MTAVLPPPITFQGYTQNGSLNAFGFVATYAAGSTTPIATYTDATQAQVNQNPVPLNAIGQAAIWLAPGIGYKFVETDQLGNQCGFADQINAAAAGVSSNLLPTINNVFNVGSPTFQWDNGYFGGNLFINGVAVFSIQTAAEASASVVPVNLQYQPFHVDRYGTNTTPGTTSMVAAFNAAIKVAQVGGGTVRYGAGTYLLDSPVNATFASSANQEGILIQGPAFSLDHPVFPLLARHTGVAVFDCTGNDAITFSDVSITTDAVTFPQTGILFARANSAGNNSQVNRLTRCNISGSFSVACYYNYGSEDDVLDACYFGNFALTAGTKTRVYTANNISGLISPFVTIRTGPQSCIDHNDFGCQDYNLAGTATSDCIYLEQTDSFKKFGGWAYSASNSSNGRALIYVDMTNAASNFCSINGLTGEQAGSLQSYGILFSNNSAIPVGWSVNDCKLPNGTNAISAGALVSLDNFKLQGTTAPTGGGIIISGTLQNSPSFDYGGEVACTIGTSVRNRLTGDTALLTVTTRTNDYWIDTGTTNKSIATVGTSGGISSSAGALIARARLILSGPCLTFQVILASAGGTVSIAGGSQISLTAPGGQSLALADTSACTVIDQVAGTMNGAGVTNTGTSILITIPVAVSATTHNIVISGTVFLA